MLSAVMTGITASNGTSQKSATFRRMPSSTGTSVRARMTSGWMPIERSVRTECWVGLVFTSSVACR